MILREGDGSIEVLFIERARHDADPWSGDLGFPGGKVEKCEEGRPRQSAERETLEEIGLDLNRGCFLGRLDDIRGAHLPIVVSCFVYAVDDAPALRLNHEIARSFWFPLAELAANRRHIETTVRFGGERLQRPAILLLPPEEPVLWGITYRLVRQFLLHLDLWPLKIDDRA